MPVTTPSPTHDTTPGCEQLPQGTELAYDRLQEGVAAVIKQALAEKVMSQSSVAGVTITGNHYQSVELGSEVLPGFREPRNALFAGFEFTGSNVCDLGANLGEMTRKAARRQAVQVDGYEYDKFYNQIAAYISTYGGFYNVKHICADVSKPGFMLRSYDVTMSLSSWAYVGMNLDHICQHTTEIMIVETHEVGPDWPAHYVDRLEPYFPYWCCFAIAPHGDAGTGKRRLWLTFSKHPLHDFYRRRSDELKNLDHPTGIIDVDLEQSDFPFLDQTRDLWGLKYFRRSEDVCARLRQELHLFEERSAAGENLDGSLSGRVYWLAFLLGYKQFETSGTCTEENIYYRWLRRGLSADQIDPGLKPLLASGKLLQSRAISRFELLLKEIDHTQPSDAGGVLGAFNLTPYHDAYSAHKLNRIVLTDGFSLCLPNLDGHHRLFAYKLTGRKVCRMMTIWDLSYLDYLPRLARSTNYKERILQHLGSAQVDDPVFHDPGLSMDLLAPNVLQAPR